MPSRGKRKCPRCYTPYQSGESCAVCAARRGTRDPAERGYKDEHVTRFRPGVLERNPYCVLCIEKGVLTPSTDADHYPTSRRDLIRAGLDPNDPRYGRGLCSPHHKSETARRQPGGWNRNDT